ncbi:MAG: gliding motility-associated C-terminal domain-containing protein [Bacteroidales bacterium]
MKNRLLLYITVLLLVLSFSELKADGPLRVNSMPSWSANHAWSNFLFNDTIIIWGTAFGGTPPYNDSIKIDGVWIPDSPLFEDPYPVVDPANYLYGHLISRRVVFYSCGFHTVEVKVTDAAGNTQVSQSTILIHNNPSFDILVDMRIERALLYLFKNCLEYQDLCYWRGYDTDLAINFDGWEFAATAASILCFEESNHIYTNDSMTNPFAVMLRRGMRYLFENAGQIPIYNHDDGTGLKTSDLFTSTVTPSGMCSTGNLRGSYLYSQFGNDFTYANSFGMMAISLSQADSNEAQSNYIENGCFQNWSYYKFIKDALDLTYFYQGDFSERGGWGYVLSNSTYFDGSLEQWPPLYMAAIEARQGIASPTWVKENVIHLYSMLTSADGGCGYVNGEWNVNSGKTGGMLASYAWAGKLIDNGDAEALNALEYLENKYNIIGSTGDNSGWFGNFYPMYAVKKGLALQNVQYIMINGEPRDWYRDMVAWLTGGDLWTLPSNLLTAYRNEDYAYGQRPEGSWTDLNFMFSRVLATCHAILVLTPNIFNVPVPSPTPVYGICHGDSIQLTCTTGTSYEWFSDPNGFYSTLHEPYVTPDNTTVYFSFVYDTIGCINEVDSVRIIIWPYSNPQPAYNEPACAGDTLKLFSQPGMAHTWSGPGGFNSNAQNPTILSCDFSNTGWYYIIMDDTMGCYAYDSIFVEVHAPPVAVVSSNNPVCTNDSLVLQGSGGVMYEWVGPQGFNSLLQNPVIHGFQSNMNGYYYLTVTNDAGCASMDSILINGFVSPVVQATSNSPVCEGDTLLLQAEGGSTYLWTGPAGFNAAFTDTIIQNSSLSHSGNFMVVAFDQNNCKDTAYLNVIIKAAPQIINTYITQPFCHSDSNGAIQLTVAGGGPFTYNWDCCPGINAPQVTNLIAGTYFVTITNTEGCERIQEFTLPNPEPFSIESIVYPDTCKNRPMGKIELTQILGQNPPYSFAWSNGQISQNASNLYYGTYQVTITDIHGCDAVFDFEVGFLSDPHVDISPDTTSVCKGDSVLLEASGCNYYLWAPAWWLSQTNGSLVWAFPNQSTTVSVVGSDQYNCLDTAASFVKVIPLPELNLGEDIWLPFGQQTTLTVPYGYDNYLWSTGSGDYSIIIADTGLYWLTIWNSICQNTDSIHVYEITDIWVPNAFTPDMDGKNDFFSAICMSCTEMEMQVYNRWGEVIFESTSLDATWDGTFDGDKCPVGIYVYSIKFRKPSPRNYEGMGLLKGTVLLMR